MVNSFCQTSGRCDKKISAEQLEDVGVFAWSVSLRSRRGSLMQQLISFFGLTAVVVILSGPAHCQGVGASGDIKGMVTDANHATVPKVKILVVATQTGLQRSLLTDDAGEFWVTDLAPTTYDVSAEFQGFETAIQKNVTVTIGQTVIVKNGTVVAVEALEGTNEAIRRGGALAREGAVMVKVAKPNLDMRFDVPVIGVETIRTAAETQLRVIAVEAGKTLLLERDAIVDLAERSKISIVAR